MKDESPMKKPSHIPAYTLPQRNRRVVLAHRPAGIPQAHDFAFDEVAVPDPGVD
jgi:NADPH-dependent curcumin reductase CurA